MCEKKIFWRGLKKKKKFFFFLFVQAILFFFHFFFFFFFSSHIDANMDLLGTPHKWAVIPGASINPPCSLRKISKKVVILVFLVVFWQSPTNFLFPRVEPPPVTGAAGGQRTSPGTSPGAPIGQGPSPPIRGWGGMRPGLNFFCPCHMKLIWDHMSDSYKINYFCFQFFWKISFSACIGTGNHRT